VEYHFVAHFSKPFSDSRANPARTDYAYLFLCHFYSPAYKEDFILIYGDLFFDITNFSDIVETENAIAVFKVEDVSRYGEVMFEDGRLKGIREKSGFGEGFIPVSR